MPDDTLTDLRQTIAALAEVLDAINQLFGRPEAGVQGDPSAA